MSGIHNNIPNYNNRLLFDLRNEATQEAIKNNTHNERITKTYEAMAPLNEIGPLKAANRHGEPIEDPNVPL